MEGTSVSALEIEWGQGTVLWALNWDCGGDQYQKQEALNKGSDGVKTNSCVMREEREWSGELGAQGTQLHISQQNGFWQIASPFWVVFIA